MFGRYIKRTMLPLKELAILRSLASYHDQAHHKIFSNGLATVSFTFIQRDCPSRDGKVAQSIDTIMDKGMQ